VVSYEPPSPNDTGGKGQKGKRRKGKEKDHFMSALPPSHVQSKALVAQVFNLCIPTGKKSVPPKISDHREENVLSLSPLPLLPPKLICRRRP
jgi:hypothetical protein